MMNNSSLLACCVGINDKQYLQIYILPLCNHSKQVKRSKSLTGCYQNQQMHHLLEMVIEILMAQVSEAVLIWMDQV